MPGPQDGPARLLLAVDTDWRRWKPRRTATALLQALV